MATKEELLEKAKELEIEGRSSMNKEELEKAVSEAESSSSEPQVDEEAAEAAAANETGFSSDGKDSEASDPQNEEVVEELSPEGQEALEEMGADSESAELADLAADASGPLHLQAPSERIMTGAVNEEHAKEQEEALASKPEDFVGDVTEAGFDDGKAASARASRESEEAPAESNPEKTRAELRAAGELKQEDVIDFPPPVGAEEEAELPSAGDEPLKFEKAGGPFSDTQVAGASDRTFSQKAVLYTDGLGGAAEQNLERAYEIPELLQSNNPVVREAGDESLSEGHEPTEEEQQMAEEVKSGELDQQESSDE